MVECSTTDQLCLHLATVEDSDESPAPYGASAPGLAELLGLGTNALSGRFELFSALSELQQRGLVEERTALVATLGEQRRVYRLTEAGENYARTVRQQLTDQEITVKTGGGVETLSLSTAAEQFEESLAELLGNVEDDVLVAEDDIDSGSSPESLPFVDRDEELTWLEDMFERTPEKPTAALVTGEPGIGKTMLVDELGRRITEQGGLFLHGQCQASATEPYYALKDAFDDLPSPVAAEVTELLTAQQGVEPDDQDELDTRRRSLFTRVREELTTGVADRPVVLFVDDATWLDRPTALLFAHLVDQLSGELFLGILAGRPTGTGPSIESVLSRRDIDVEPLDLDSFGRSATEELICRLVGTRRVPGTFTDVVQEHTGGNPLFITESVTRMLEEGVVKPAVGVYPEGREELLIPDTVEESITGRLDLLDGDTRELVELATLVGDVFPEPVVTTASSLDAGAVRERVELLVESRLWERDGNRLRFTSPAVRESIRDTIPEDRRRSLHRHIAESYQEQDSSERQAAAISYHYEAAGDVSNAIGASLTAAQRATDVYAHETAIEACERALDLAQDIGDDDSLVEALERLGETHVALGEFDEAERCYRYVRTQSETAEVVQRMYRKQGEVARRQGEYEQAHSHLENALDVTDGNRREEAATLNELGVVGRKQREFESTREYFQRSLDIYEAIDDPTGVATALKNLGTVAVRVGDFSTAREYYQRALDSYEEIGDRNGAAKCLNNIAIIAWKEGDVETAREFFQRSLDIDRDLEYRHGEAKTLNNLGLVERREGNISEAREYLQTSLELKQELGARHDVATSLNNLGILAAIEGEFTDAREYVRRSLTLFEELGDSEFVAKSHGLLGLVAVSEGDLEEGRAQLDDALSQLAELGAIPTALEVLRYHLETELDADNTERARALCERAQSLVDDAETELGYEREQVQSLCETVTTE